MSCNVTEAGSYGDIVPKTIAEKGMGRPILLLLMAAWFAMAAPTGIMADTPPDNILPGFEVAQIGDTSSTQLDVAGNSDSICPQASAVVAMSIATITDTTSPAAAAGELIGIEDTYAQSASMPFSVSRISLHQSCDVLFFFCRKRAY